MLLKFDRGLTTMAVHAQGQELATIMGMDRDDQGHRVVDYPLEFTRHVATFHDPVLITDYHRIGALGAEDPVLRDTVMALYGQRSRTTIYDGTRLDFEQARHPGVWGPSIDTLLCCRAFSKLDLLHAHHAIEIGAGSGFITKYLLEHHPAIQRATMVDMMPGAILTCQENVMDPRARFYLGDGLEFLESVQADLIYSNPPYIPRPSSIDDNPYEGVFLLVQLIESAPRTLRPGGSLVLNLSSLCLDTAIEAIERTGLRYTIVDEMTVPLKVFNVLNNPDWLSYLVDERGMLAERRDGYDYWHTVSVLNITR